jgi:hypothetical protein
MTLQELAFQVVAAYELYPRMLATTTTAGSGYYSIFNQGI